MEVKEEEEEFGALYYNVLKPISSSQETHHNFGDKKSSTNLNANLLNVYDGILLSEFEDGELVSDEENEDNSFIEHEVVDNKFVDSESDDSLDIIVCEGLNNDNTIASDKKKDAKDSGIFVDDGEDYLDDDHDVGVGKTVVEKRNPNLNGELGHAVAVAAKDRVECSYQSFPAISKGSRPVFTPETDYRGSHNPVHPFRNADYGHGTKLHYRPAPYKTAFDIDLDKMSNKPWERPDVDVSDYFNFDFDEKNWKKYCKEMKQLLAQIYAQSKAVDHGSERLQPKFVPEQPVCRGIQLDKRSGEQVVNNHRRICDSDAIIEIVLTNEDPALREYKTCSNTVHKSINGDKILPFPLDGSSQHKSHEERRSNNYVKEGRQRIDLESMEIKEKDRLSYQDTSMHLEHPKGRRLPADGPPRKWNARKPIYPNKFSYGTKNNWQSDNNLTEKRRMFKVWDCRDTNYPLTNSHKSSDELIDKRKNTEDQSTLWNRLEEKRWKQEVESFQSKPTADVYDNQGSTGRISNSWIKTKETFYEPDHHKGHDDSKLVKGKVIEQDSNNQLVTDPGDYEKQEFRDTDDDVVSCDQKHEAKRDETLNEEYSKFQGCSMSRELYMENELIDDINDFVREINDLVDNHNHAIEDRELRLKSQTMRNSR